VVPILTATLTIIASFLPLAFLSGTSGEFIRTLPITVAVALSCSFIVAMLLTPILCRTFIKKGLHSDAAPGHRFSPLDLMQRVYERAIALAMGNKRMAVIVGALTIVVGVILLLQIPQQFFPYAERDQLVVDIWLPEGTRIEETDRIARRLEAHVRRQPGVEQVATFLGAGAPRFFYNVNPEFLASNYAQLLVGTSSAEASPEVVRELHLTLGALAPDARITPKELAEGPNMDAPIEVRVSGDDLRTLKRIGARVTDILRDTPGSALVHRDWREDSYDLLVTVDTDVANRLGLHTALVAQQLSGGFGGQRVSTYWEGSRPVDIVLRYPERERRTFEDIQTSYVLSQLTGARLPLLQVARVEPEWQTSRIVRRNGVRTLTVRSEAQPGVLPSEVLAKAASQIDRLKLPAGYSIEYGGEHEEQADTFADMRIALAVGLIAIFLILLFQFRSVFEPPIIMVSIPLALFGAALGLMITENPFGFTAFMGLISLAGVVVRNAIILVDHIIERRHAGSELETAALEAGRRRLRPIFLTTMAAAVGVLPMILSGSPLWSPMASVISVGLLCSMVFTLLVVPVLYVLVERRRATKAL
jgi:multidrug efflux pump subunit AcrB